MLKSKEIRAMKADERNNALTEAQKELMHERGVAAMGGAMRNPGKIRALRRQIARILTIQKQPAAEDSGAPRARRSSDKRGSSKAASKPRKTRAATKSR